MSPLMSRHSSIRLLVNVSTGSGVKFDGEHFGLLEVVGAFMMLRATKLLLEDVYSAPHFLGQCCSLLSLGVDEHGVLCCM
jgi:hypothetical protein